MHSVGPQVSLMQVWEPLHRPPEDSSTSWIHDGSKPQKTSPYLLGEREEREMPTLNSGILWTSLFFYETSKSNSLGRLCLLKVQIFPWANSFSSSGVESGWEMRVTVLWEQKFLDNMRGQATLTPLNLFILIFLTHSLVYVIHTLCFAFIEIRVCDQEWTFYSCVKLHVWAGVGGGGHFQGLIITGRLYTYSQVGTRRLIQWPSFRLLQSLLRGVNGI